MEGYTRSIYDERKYVYVSHYNYFRYKSLYMYIVYDSASYEYSCENRYIILHSMNFTGH